MRFKLRYFLAILFCTFLASCGIRKPQSEFDKIIIDNNLKSVLFNSTDSILNPLTIKTEKGYDGLVDSTLYAVNSNVIVNKDSLRLIRFTELKQIDTDNLELKIYETNTAYSQSLTIKIIGNKFKTEFNYLTSGPLVERKIRRLKQELSIKSIPRRQGEMIYGKLYFKGSCESGCSGDIEIYGDFKVKLK